MNAEVVTHQSASPEQAHGSRTLVYLVIAGILTIITVGEVWTSYIHALRPVLVPLLVVLSGAKFALVVMFYMHLRYDSWVFSAIFLPLLLLAGSVVLVLLGLMLTFLHGGAY